MKPPFFSRSLRWRLLLSIASLGILFSITLILISTRSQQELTELALSNTLSVKRQGLIDQGELLANILAQRLRTELAAGRFAEISAYLEDELTHHPLLQSVTVTDPRNGSHLLELRRVDSIPGEIIEFIKPIDPHDATKGNLILAFSAEPQQKQMAQISEQMTANSQALIKRSVRISILFLIAGITLILFVSHRLAKPVIALTQSAEAIARGHFSATREIDTAATDEIGALSRAFVTMANDLQASYQELRQTADEARRAGAFLDTIFETLPHMIFVKRADDLRLIRVNKAAETIIGLPREKILDQLDHNLFPEEQANFFNEMDRAVLVGGQTVDIPEEKLVRPDGGVRYLHTRKIPILDSNGKPLYLLGISEDISEQKSSQEERRLFFNHSMDLMCIASMDGRFEQVNPAFVAALGYSAEELCNRPYFDFVHPDDLESTVTAAMKLNEGEKVVSFENRYFCKDGSIRWLTWNAGINREFKKVYAVARDTTERRNMEERIFQATQQEQERIARDLHDGLGQILTALAFKGKLMEQQLLSGEKPEARQAAEVVALANRASEQARVLARGLDPVVLREGLVMALKDLAHNTEESFGIACRLENDGEVENLDKGVANHLFRIAQEAVNNVVKHGMARTIRIRVHEDENLLTMSVENDGLIHPGEIRQSDGLGIHTMNYRAKLIGGALVIQPNASGGMTVRCTIRRRSPVTEKEMA